MHYKVGFGRTSSVSVVVVVVVVVVVRTGDRNTITSIECSKADRSTMDFILNT